MRSFTAVLAFKSSESLVAMVRKNAKKLPHLNGKLNGIGGEIEIGESPSGAAVREFTEETGIVIDRADLVSVEHQRFDILTPTAHEIYWYACRLGPEATLPEVNDVGEELHWVPRSWIMRDTFNSPDWAPNIQYLVPKAIIMLRTPHLARPV
jgi:8-oxo-dGTP pyrophosphatase MutT (NUDIX family)